MVNPDRVPNPVRVDIGRIALRSLAPQTWLVAQIEKEQAQVAANKDLIAIYEQKIKDTIAKVWGEEQQA